MERYSSRKKMPKPERGRLLLSIGSFLLGTLVGTIFGLYINYWFVKILPGPQITASVVGYRPMTSKTAGCIFYTVRVDGGDQPIESVYMMVQFPTKINNFKVGHPREAQTAITGRAAMWMWTGDKDAQGACIINAPPDDSVDVQGSHTGNMLKINASKLPSKTTIIGIIATNEGESSIKPAPPSIYTEGTYEYSMLGQTVRKALRVSDAGITDLK